jgi:hypothetical protein
VPEVLGEDHIERLYQYQRGRRIEGVRGPAMSMPVRAVDAKPLSPFPQLLPDLDECLHFSRAGQSVVNQTAILEGTFVEFPYAAGAQMRQVVSKLLKLFLIQNIRLFVTGTPGHSERS